METQARPASTGRPTLSQRRAIPRTSSHHRGTQSAWSSTLGELIGYSSGNVAGVLRPRGTASCRAVGGQERITSPLRIRRPRSPNPSGSR